MLVSDFLEKSADIRPEKTALVCGVHRFVYQELEAAANRMAHGLKDLGVRRGDRVVVFLEPSVEAVVSIFATLKAGGVFVPVNPQVKARKAAFLLDDCQAKALITDTSHLEEIIGVIPECPYLETVVLTDYSRAEAGGLLRRLRVSGKRDREIRFASYRNIQEEFPSDRPQRTCIDIDLASLIYTSGSTGRAKGVMLTHQNMVSASASIITYLENTSDDIILDVLPLSFDYGLYQVLMAFRFGGTVILERSFLYAYRIIDLILKEGVTGFPVVPTIVAILLKMKKLEQYDFSGLRYITSTGQALPAEHIRRLREIFKGTRIYSMYGLTECKRVSYLPPDELDRRPTSVGKAMPNTEVYIVDEEGKRVNEPGKVGELVVRGANVMRGYWNLPRETDAVLNPGPVPGEKVLYTGDLFRMDEEEFLYFVGRRDDVLKVAAERVSPKEVENVLHGLKGIAEVAVVGVPDAITGQAVKAFVVLEKGSRLGKREILGYCSRNMENFMVPKYVEIRKSLPRTPHGKVNKKALEAQG